MIAFTQDLFSLDSSQDLYCAIPGDDEALLIYDEGCIRKEVDYIS